MAETGGLWCERCSARLEASFASDRTTAPDQRERIAHEMIVKDKVASIGIGITPSALTAPDRGEGRGSEIGKLPDYNLATATI
jgi:hypothetical protein